jgi:hypothetical protein
MRIGKLVSLRASAAGEIRFQTRRLRGVVRQSGDPQRAGVCSFVHQQSNSASSQCGDGAIRIAVHLVIAEDGEERCVGIEKASGAEELRREVWIVIDEIAGEDDDVGSERLSRLEELPQPRRSSEDAHV